jgi:7-cyano-7-deazaguanine synthase in queuosine biosynthesis
LELLLILVEEFPSVEIWVLLMAFAVLEMKIPNLLALHVDYDQISSKAEWKAVKAQASALNIECMNVHFGLIRKLNRHGSCLLLNGEGSHEVRGRNISLILCAAGYGDDILLGSTEDAMYDTTEEFVEAMNVLFSKHFSLDNKPRLLMPPLKEGPRKEDAYNYGMKVFGMDFHNKFTMTCWTANEDETECGKCKHCRIKLNFLEKWRSLNYQGNSDGNAIEQN